MPNDDLSSPDHAEVAGLFAASAQANRDTLGRVQEAVIASVDALMACFAAGGKMLACGNGGSSGDAQHLASELVNRFERERRALAAIALTTESSTITAIANDYGYARVFARQIEALGQPGDVLVAISTSGSSENVVNAVDAAQEQGLRVIAFTGRDGGHIARQLEDNDIELRAASDVTAHIQEMHLLIIHCICRLIEHRIAG